MQQVMVAYSGGVDSTFLLKVAHLTLGDRAVGVIGKSPSLPAADLEQALGLAEEWGARVQVIDTDEMSDANYTSNPDNRCYFCKSELFTKLGQMARERGFAWIADGMNCDDRGDYRPGETAARENNVRSPLIEAGLTKQDIRILSQGLGLPTWDKPEAACLASRIPHGTAVTLEALQRIEASESFLKSLGLRQVRVRHHDSMARIETTEDEMELLWDPTVRRKVVARLKELGYKFVTVDLAGYRRGSFNPDSATTSLLQIQT